MTERMPDVVVTVVVTLLNLILFAVWYWVGYEQFGLPREVAVGAAVVIALTEAPTARRFR